MSNKETFAESPKPGIELWANESEAKRVMERISGVAIERRLQDLAQIGGTRIDGIPEQEERYAVGRVALSETDHEAREKLVKPWMKEAGMTVEEHPLGIIGIFPGKDPTLDPLLFISHTDSVPKAGMYDGPMGVVTGIEVIDAMHKEDIQPERTMMVVSVTGEEAAGFGFALFGSRGMFHGLTEADLDQRRKGGASIREALGPDDSQITKTPIFGPGLRFPEPYASIEYHIEQHRRLDEAGIDIGIVERIASPIRHSIEIGDEPLKPDNTVYPNTRFMKLTVTGKADHSGATPMGQERADGLVATSDVLSSAIINKDTSGIGNMAIGDVNIEAQAINKIPGTVNTILRFSADKSKDVEKAIEEFNRLLKEKNVIYSDTYPHFEEHSFSLGELSGQEMPRFFRRDEIQPRQEAAINMILKTHTEAYKRRQDKVVGTMGTWTTSSDGKITLEIDVRGVLKEPRDTTFREIEQNAKDLTLQHTRVDMGRPSAGSGADPSDMNPTLMKLTANVIDKYNIGRSMVMDSPAGHDTQNVERKNIPTIVIFSQSNNGGYSHHPDEYTSPENMEKGARAVAALAMELVMRPKEHELKLT